MVNDNVVKLRESPNKNTIVASLKRLSEGIEVIHNRVKETDDSAFLLHDEALQELSRALWYPLILQFRRRKLRGLQQRAKKLEQTGRELTAMLRSIEAFYGKIPGSTNVIKVAESVSPQTTTLDDTKTVPLRK
jgi:hypothetical protein